LGSHDVNPSVGPPNCAHKRIQTSFCWVIEAQSIELHAETGEPS
jgi:hypothetical protein